MQLEHAGSLLEMSEGNKRLPSLCERVFVHASSMSSLLVELT